MNHFVKLEKKIIAIVFCNNLWNFNIVELKKKQTYIIETLKLLSIIISNSLINYKYFKDE